MKTWHQLYAMIWLNFLTLLVPFLQSVPQREWVHMALGTGALALALLNRQTLMKVECPARLRRIATVSVGMGVVGLVTGALMHAGMSETLHQALKVAHLTVVVAATAQSASVATAFDMWSSKEVA
jgi:hypothetical protein